MRQTLFYIPPEIFGFPVFGFGIAFVLLVFGLVVVAAWQYAKTKKFDEDIWSYLGFLIVGGAILVFVAPNIMEPKGFPIRGYGVFLLIAILSALALVLKLSKPKGISAETIFSLCLWAVISGILGARLFYVTEYWTEMVTRDPSSGELLIGRTLYNIVNIPDGGLVVFGSILGGALGSLIFMIRNKLPVLLTFDSMAPAMMLGLAIGRIGCLMNGCCFGGPSDACWAIIFPKGSPAHLHQIHHGDTFYYGMTFQSENDSDPQLQVVRIKEVQKGSEAEKSGIKPGMKLRGISSMIDGKPLAWETRSLGDLLFLFNRFLLDDPGARLRFDIYTDDNQEKTQPFFLEPGNSEVRPVHPTQIYSSISAAVVCCVLLLLGRLAFYKARPGLVFASFLLLYPIARFCLEMIRTDEDSFLGTGLTVSQNVSIGVFIAGILLTIYIVRQYKNNPLSIETAS